MADWKPDLYLQFERDRTLPARDLLSRVPSAPKPGVVDLGCGPGNSTQLLAELFPDGRIEGVDNSPAMIAAAKKRLPGVAFTLADAAAWRPERPLDVIFANALFQWMPSRLATMRALLGHVKPGGCLAVQMPDNWDEPSHALMRALAARPPFRALLAEAALARAPIEPLQVFYDALIQEAREVDVWRTTYVHALAGPDAIVGWVSSTGLKPYLDALGAEGRAAFLAAYRAEIVAAYPARPDGKVLFPFPRIFVVARR